MRSAFFAADAGATSHAIARRPIASTTPRPASAAPSASAFVAPQDCDYSNTMENSMRKRYITVVDIKEDGTKVVRMHPLGKRCCCICCVLKEILPYLAMIVIASELLFYVFK